MITVMRTAQIHVNEIYEIEKESFPDPWSVSAISQEIADKHSVCFVALYNTRVVGHVTMRHIINEGHISNIAVAKKDQRMGVGSLLLSALIDEAIKMEMIGVTLEVRQSNTAAIKLYQNHDFVEEGRRKNYYQSPTEDALIMWRYIYE